MPMRDFLFYFKIGWNHIISWDATDHLYFIAALAIVYCLKDWRKLLVLVTAFTIGHAITLYLSAMDWFRFSIEWVEFAIPCTIIATAGFNFFPVQSRIWIRYAMALGFGLIHGLGYANYIRMMMSTSQNMIWNLFSFNVGLEIGQIFVVLLILLVVEAFRQFRSDFHKYLVVIFSLVVMLLSLKLAWERFPLF
jgi:hypothetical protein